MNPIQIYDNIGCEFILSESDNYFIIGSALRGYNTLNNTHVGSYIPYLVRNISSDGISWEIGTGFVDKDGTKIVIRDRKIIESNGLLNISGQKSFYIFAHAHSYNTGFNNVIVKYHDFVVDRAKTTYLVETNDLIHATLPNPSDCEAVEIYFQIIGDDSVGKLDIRDGADFHTIIKGTSQHLRIVSDGDKWITLSQTNSENQLSILSNGSSFSALSDPTGEENSFQYKDGSSFAGANVFWGSNNKVLFGSGTVENTAKHIIPTSGNYDLVINNIQDGGDFIVRGSGLPSGYLPKNLIFTYDGKLGLNLPSGARPQTALHIVNNSCRESIRIENLSSCPTHIPNVTLYHKPSGITNDTIISKIVSSSKDSNNNKTDYASISAYAKTITANSAQGQLNISVISGVNSLTTFSTEPNSTFIGDSSRYSILCSNGSGIRLYNNLSSGLISLDNANNAIIHTNNNISMSGGVVSVLGNTSLQLSSSTISVNGTTNINQALIVSSGGNVAFPLLTQNQILAINSSGFLAPATGFSFGGIGANRLLATDTNGIVHGPFPTNAFLPTYDDFIWTRYISRAAYVSQRQLSFIEPVPLEEFDTGDQIVITTGTGANLTSLYRNIRETIVVNNAISGILVDQNIGDANLCNVVGDCRSITKGGVLTIQVAAGNEDIASEASATIISTRPNNDTIFNTLRKNINFKVFGIEEDPAISVLAKASLVPVQSGEYFRYATNFKDSFGNNINPFIIPLNSIGIGADSTNNSANFGNPAWSGKVSSVGSNGRPSYYGTYDQNGNVFEWVSQQNSTIQNVCGGSWRTNSSENLRSVIPTPYGLELDDVGFRICSRFGFVDTSSTVVDLDLSFVPVSNADNLSDTSSVFTENYTNRTGLGLDPQPTAILNLGRVDQPYQIGKYEITNAQYAEFLNAVNKISIFDLYNSNMITSSIGGITRVGSEGSYIYSTKTNMNDKPVVFVDYLSAIRFTNWLNNGAPTGTGVNSSHTEDGAYTIIVGESSTNIITNKYQKYWIPTLNEWHKAAYFRPIVNTVSGDKSAVLIRTNIPFEVSSGNLASLTVAGSVYADDLIIGNINEVSGSLLSTKDYDGISGVLSSLYGYDQYQFNIGPRNSITINNGSEDWDGSYSNTISSNNIELATSGTIKLISPNLIRASGLSVDDMFIKNLNFLDSDGDIVEGGLYPGVNGGFVFKNLENENVSASNILKTVSLGGVSFGVSLSTASFLEPIYVNTQGVLAGYNLMKFGTTVQGIQGSCVTIGATGTELSDSVSLAVEKLRVGPPLASYAGSVLVHNGEDVAVWQPGDFLRADGVTWNRYPKRAVQIMNSSTLRFSNLDESQGGTGPITAETILLEFGIEDTIAIYNQNRDVFYVKLADIVLLGDTGSDDFFNNPNTLEIVICPQLPDSFIEGARLDIPNAPAIDVGYAFSVHKGAYLDMSIEKNAISRFTCAGIDANAADGFKPSTMNTISIRPTVDTAFNKIAEDINFTIYGYTRTLNNRYEPSLFGLDSRGIPSGLTPAFHIESYIDSSFKGSVISGVFNTNDILIASGLVSDNSAKITINTKNPYVVTSLLGIRNGVIPPDSIRPTGERILTTSDISTYADLTINGYTYSSGIISTELVLKNSSSITYVPNAPLTINSFGQIVSVMPPAPPTVPGLPSSIAGFASNNSVRLYWTKPADDGNSPIVDYIIEYSDNDGADWTRYEHEPVTDDEMVIDGLENSVVYRFRVSAINLVGQSGFSDPSAGIRPTSNAPSKPINLTIISRTSSTILLDWAAPTYIGPVGSTLDQYFVEYAEATDPPSSLTWQTIEDIITNSDITISGLTEEPTYYIRVRAKNNLAQGAYAIIKSVGTAGEPEPPDPQEDPTEIWDFGVVQFTGVCT
jgi:hypothetical protein